ncbi:hypothetical protein MJI95_35555, partial [Salmonella enterica subsp. enterica serovar Kentucky]|nr:hypothetical protein [Salmonella enterica subsp. enterica serovar Kentucky]
GLTLPHEHLFNDLSSVVDEPHYAFSQELVGKKVSADLQWGLKPTSINYIFGDKLERIIKWLYFLPPLIAVNMEIPVIWLMADIAV